MATSLHPESRRRYSWWWDSHISPKNSKWLQENLTDMDSKVKIMIKLIEEDADSFAKRAEMYYKKRPELMRLVEDFYRAYRALAERYDHATRALRQAHRTMAEAFPNQVPFRLADDLPSASSASEAAPHTPETLHELHPILDPDDLHKDAQGVLSSHFHAIKRNGAYSNESDSATSKKGLKQLDELFGSGKGASNSVNFAEGRMRKGLNYNEEDKKGSKHEMHSESRERPNHMMKENKRSVQVDNSSQNSNTWIVSSSERACNDENEVQTLKDSLATLEAEKEAGLLQYQHALERLSNLEGEVSHAQEDATGFNQQACKARTEVETLNEALTKLQEEKEASLVQYQQFSERMYELEKKLSCVQEDRGNERAIEAESKAQLLKQALARVEAEKEASLLQYSQCLQKISNLESNVFLAEENARKFYERAVGAETEVQFLKESISQLHEEKEAASLQYQLSLERISNLQSELSHAQEEARRLSNVIVMGYAKLNSTEEQYLQLEKENRSLQEEIDALVEMMETQKQELSEKHEELDRLQLCIQEEAWRVNDENKILKEQNLSSASSIKNLQDEILRLSGAEMKLGKEVEVLVDQRDALQQEIYGLKEEMNNLKKQHLCVMEQMELVGLKPDSFMTSVKSLQEENSSLRETCQKDNDEKVSLLEKLNNFENLYKRNALLESCLSDANARLELLREKVKALEETCQYLRGETFTLVDEKEALISQLEVTNGNIEKLSEKNTLLETFLFDAHVERVWLRGKSKCLEDFCLSLDSEKSDLLAANEFLVSQSKGIQKKMGDLEERYTDLEEKHLGLKKELESRIHQVEDVQVTLVLEKEEHANFILSSGTQLAHLKGNINALQEEGMRRMKDFEEEENKTVKAQLEMFILQRCIQDMEEKFRALFIEYQQHLETSVLSENRVVNLGRENFEQQVKVNSLVDQVGCLRLAICQIALSLEFNPDYECQGKIEQDQILLQLAMGKIKDLKESVWTIEDEKYQLLFENSILLTLFDQLRLEEASIESERSILDTDLRLRTEELLLLQSEKNVLRNASDELNHQIGIGKDLLNQKEVKLSEAEQRLQAIEGENNELNIKLSDLNRECNETRVLKEVLEKKILNISVDNTRKDKEIECLHETTEKLELEVAKLHESIEEQRVKTDDLRSELQKQINAVELWESEAEIMYGNCQITTIHAALFKEKVYELAGACERLQNERDSKTKNVEQLIERLVALECENKGLNCNLAGYSHIMVSLRDSVTSLEDCVFRQTKDYAADNQEPEVADLASHQCDSSYKELTENQGLEGGHEVSDMLELQYRIKNIECSMVEQKRLMLQENTDKDIRLEAAMKEIQKLEQFGNESSNLRLCNTEPDFSEVGDGILVKDIPLDKVSHCSSYDHGFGPRALSRREDSVTNELIVESWETVEQGFDLDFAFNQQRKLSAVHTEEKSDCYQMEALEDKSECPSSEIQSEEVGIVSEGVMVHQGDKRKVLERLASDKQKLLNLQVTVEDLKKKVEQFERCRIPKDTEYSTVKEHLKEVEAAISQLIGTNGKLAKKAGGHSVTSNRKVAEDLEETGKGRRCRISEQARRVSEKIGRLQLEVQRIQFSLLRLEGAKGTKAADRKVLLKDYLYGIQKSRPIDKRKKRLFFSCVKPPST